MTTFGLVHGAYHGSWCWQQLTDLLEVRGHRVLTVDLPCEDPDAGASEYAEATVEAFSDAPEDLVLVGHSLGGLTIPVVAARRLVSRMVFVSAMLPRPGRPHDDVMRDEPDMALPGPAGGSYVAADGSTRWYPDAAAALFSPTAFPLSPHGRRRGFAVSSGRSPRRSRRFGLGRTCPARPSSVHVT